MPARRASSRALGAAIGIGVADIGEACLGANLAASGEALLRALLYRGGLLVAIISMAYLLYRNQFGVNEKLTGGFLLHRNGRANAAQKPIGDRH